MSRMHELTMETAHQYADAVFEHASGSDFSCAVEQVFHLPGLSITGRFVDPQYLGFCQENLVTTDAPSNDKAKSITIAVLDQISHPRMPSGQWVDGEFSIKILADHLSARDLFGSYDAKHQLWQFYSEQQRFGVQAMIGPQSFPPWEPAFPLRHFIHWAYQATNMKVIHAGTLGRNGTGVLFAGAGGAGKSGTTLAGLVSGLDSVGDDYIIAKIEENEVSTYPVLNKMKQDAPGLKRSGLDSKHPIFKGPNWQNKFTFDLNDLGGGRLVERLCMKAILLPQITHNSTTRIEKASGKEAMLGLSPSSVFQLVGGWRETLKFSGQLCRTLPAYKIHLGSDPAEVALVISDFIEGMSK